MGADCCKNLPSDTETEERYPNSSSDDQVKNRYHDNGKQESVSSQFFEKARFWFDQSYPNWRKVLNEEFYETETICIPESLDVGSGKYFGPTDYAAGFDNNKDIKIKLRGEKGEESFFSKFRMLKLGGILINSFYTQDFMKVMKDCEVSGFSKELIDEWKEVKKHFECDFIFIHKRIGVVIVEVKGCERAQEMIPDRKKAESQLNRSIPGLLNLYKKVTDESDCPLNVNGIVCMPCFDMKTSSKPKKESELNKRTAPEKECSYTVIEKSLMDNIDNFKQFWDDKIPKRSFSLTDNVIKFITAIMAYRPATYMSATCNALEIYRRIDIQDFKKEELKEMEIMFLNDDQRKAIKCDANRVIISGPPGTGKTLCLIQRALEMAQIDKPGRVIFVLPLSEELAPKIKKMFATAVRKYIEADKKRKERVFVIREERVPVIIKSLSFNFTPDDDLFLDEIALEYKQDELLSFQKRLTDRELQSGSTTIAVTGWMIPTQVAQMAKKKDIFTNFSIKELKIVIRGTKTIINEWNRDNFHFPKEYKLRIGHNITGGAIERYTVANTTEMLNTLRKGITALLLPLPKKEPASVKKTKKSEQQQETENNNEQENSQEKRDQPKEDEESRKKEQKKLHQSDNKQHQPHYQCTNSDIAVLIVPSGAPCSSDNIQQNLNMYGFRCGAITKQVEDSTLIAVDNATHALSYEWPIVFIIAFMEDSEEDSEPCWRDPQYLIAASRAVAKLIVITVTKEDSISHRKQICTVIP